MRNVGLIFVHGIGEQRTGDLTDQWGQAFIDSARADLPDGSEIVVLDSRQRDPVLGSKLDLLLKSPEGDVTVKIREAIWAEAFKPATKIQFLKQSLGLMPRVTARFVRQLFRSAMFMTTASIQLVAFLGQLGWAMIRDILAQANGGFTKFSMAWVLLGMAVAGLVAGFLLAVAGTVILLSLLVAPIGIAIAGLTVCIILVILSFVPKIGKTAARVVTVLSASAGDAGVWMSNDVSASSMRDVVRRAVREIRPDVERVVVVAHSQGAAVAAAACLAPDGEKVDALVTLGGAVNLLSRPSRRGLAPLGSVSEALNAWARSDTRWVNIWSPWDPVPGGPVGVTDRDCNRIWHRMTKKSYAEEVDEQSDNHDFAGNRQHGAADLANRRLPIGPEEYPANLRSSLFVDHVSYHKSLVQVVGAIVKLTVAPDIHADLRWNRAEASSQSTLIRSYGFVKLVAISWCLVAADWLRRHDFDTKSLHKVKVDALWHRHAPQFAQTLVERDVVELVTRQVASSLLIYTLITATFSALLTFALSRIDSTPLIRNSRTYPFFAAYLLLFSSISAWLMVVAETRGLPAIYTGLVLAILPLAQVAKLWPLESRRE